MDYSFFYLLLFYSSILESFTYYSFIAPIILFIAPIIFKLYLKSEPEVVQKRSIIVAHHEDIYKT